jgi:3-phosphoshikimate 1-carboxyvinyltransferase
VNSDVVLWPPISKSDAQRSLVLGHILGVPLDEILASESGVIPRDVVVPPEDGRLLPQRSNDLPRDVEILRGGLEVLARGGGEIDCRDGGAPFRFLVTQAALTCGGVTRFLGTGRLAERPHEPLLSALRTALETYGAQLPARLSWPFEVRGVAQPLNSSLVFEVDGSASSQFASSLLLGAARVAKESGCPSSVVIRGPRASDGYLVLTEAWLARVGFSLHVEDTDGAAGDRRIRVDGHQPASKWPPIPGDWSSLGYLLPMAWKAGHQVGRVDRAALHPDRLVASHFERIGLELVDVGDCRVRVMGGLHRGCDVDSRLCPDSVPALAALACLLPTPSRFTHTSILRLKESDRLAGIQELTAAAGAKARLLGETLTIEAPPVLRDLDLDARDDHRLAMSAAMLACVGGVHLTLRGKASVAKSFPSFWTCAELAGLEATLS